MAITRIYHEGVVKRGKLKGGPLSVELNSSDAPFEIYNRRGGKPASKPNMFRPMPTTLEEVWTHLQVGMAVRMHNRTANQFNTYTKRLYDFKHDGT